MYVISVRERYTAVGSVLRLFTRIIPWMKWLSHEERVGIWSLYFLLKRLVFFGSLVGLMLREDVSPGEESTTE